MTEGTDLITEETVYELNQKAYQTIYDNRGTLTQEQFENRINKIKENQNINKYSMLLCREMYDYTVFVNLEQDNSVNKIFEDVKEIIQNRGWIIDCEYDENMQWSEWWIISHADHKPHMYVLFNAQDFVIEN